MLTPTLTPQEKAMRFTAYLTFHPNGNSVTVDRWHGPARSYANISPTCLIRLIRLAARLNCGLVTNYRPNPKGLTPC